MSHNLNIVDGVASMMYVGETPWHSLGTKLDAPATASEAIRAAHLDFIVEKMPLRLSVHNIPVLDHFATVRTDTMEVLGVVGSRYTPIQNKDAFCTFDTIVGEGQAIYHTAGALGKGERIWILAKLPNYIKIHQHDIVEMYLLFTNAHNGSSAVTVKLTPIRVVCENTLSIALRGTEQEVHIRHTTSAEEKLRQAHKILGLSNRLFEILGQYYVGMSQKMISATLFSQYLNQVFQEPIFSLKHTRTKEVHEKVLELSEVGVGSELSKGTLWGAYNAVTEYVDHFRLKTKSPSTQLKSMWYGSGDALKKKAFTNAIALLN